MERSEEWRSVTEYYAGRAGQNAAGYWILQKIQPNNKLKQVMITLPP
jgi:hypothetical protein